MTISDAISTIDARKPNVFTNVDKILWLSQLDGQIYEEIMKTHEDCPSDPFLGYDADTDQSKELLAKAPYDNLYISWLESRIDYANGEYAKYNNSNTTFTAELQAYRNHYNRTHMPVEKRFRYF